MKEYKLVGIPPPDIHYNDRIYDKGAFKKSIDEAANVFKLLKRKETIKKILNNKKQ